MTAFDPKQTLSLSLLKRVLIKRGEKFDAAWTVVDLVKQQPKSIWMTQTMPPVEDERTDNPIESAFSDWVMPMPELSCIGAFQRPWRVMAEYV